MSISNKVKSSIVLALAVSSFAVAPVSATAVTSSGCTVKMVGGKNSVGEAKSRWTLNDDGTVTGSVKVTGGDDCEQTVTLAAWEAPDADKGLPYSEQKLVGHVTKTFKTGTHDISIMLPKCFYQIDLVKGSKETGKNDSPAYPTELMLGSLHGGTKTCKVTPPVTPPVTPTPTPPAVLSATKPAELPKTGIGSSVVMIALAATVVGTMFKSYSLRRNNA